MRHVMLDLETMGTSPGSAIMSIGAVEFDVKKGLGKEFYSVVSLQSCLDVGLRIDASTLMWWLQQSDEARQALSDQPAQLAQALMSFVEYLDVNCKVWAHGAAFDGPILTAAYKACGITEPYSYRNLRDTRTIYDLAGIRPSNSVGTYHNALDDAKTQALDVIKAFKALGYNG